MEQKDNKVQIKKSVSLINVTKWLENHMPPGMSLQSERRGYLFGIIISLIYSMSFFDKYNEAYSALFYMEEGKRYDAGVMMKDFIELVKGPVMGFLWLALLVFAALAVELYAYYFGANKCIYIMRRLGRPWELHKRALVLPLVLAAVTLFIGFLVLLFYLGIYMWLTPEHCLTPNQWQKLWQL